MPIEDIGFEIISCSRLHSHKKSSQAMLLWIRVLLICLTEVSLVDYQFMYILYHNFSDNTSNIFGDVIDSQDCVSFI